MDEMKKLPFETENAPSYVPPAAPLDPLPPAFPTGKRELLLLAGALLSGLMGANAVLYAGFSLGFAVSCLLSLSFSAGYLRSCGRKIRGYSAALLILSAVIAAGFARSDDSFVKFVMVCFLLVSINLSLCLISGQNRRSGDGILSLLDAPRALLRLGLGEMSPAFRGLRSALSRSAAGKKSVSVLLGLAIAVPLLAVILPLLISADAAFDGLVSLLPEFDPAEALGTLIFGAAGAWVLYTRGTALEHSVKEEPGPAKARRGLQTLTVNTVLGAVCALFLLYLFSQLAYFVGGFSGILPEGFTMAQYARRGFFEMAWLCAIDLTVISLAVGLVKKEGQAPLSTRLLCLFIGIVTVFFVITASAKMAMYIGAYGLTRLRVLTEVIMVFLGLATAIVCVWLFRPQMPYMKVILVLALAIGALVIWVDVDTVVAAYNVSAYQAGRLSSVDVAYLAELSDSAVPFLARLTEDADPKVAENAMGYLRYMTREQISDLRDWNLTRHIAQQVLQALFGR